MKWITPLIAFLFLAGCQGVLSGPPEVAQCEKYIRAKLVKPNSYKRIESASLALPYPTARYWEVGIDYSFTNASGITARGSQVCDYPLAAGKADTSKAIDFDRDNAALKVSKP